MLITPSPEIVDLETESCEETADDTIDATSDEFPPVAEVHRNDSAGEVDLSVERPRRNRSKPKWLSSGDYATD